MRERIEQQISEWENYGIGSLNSRVITTAALISRFDDVPEEVFEALSKLDLGNPEGRSKSVYLVVKNLRSKL